MVLNRLKLHQFLMVWHENFPTHKHAVLYHLITLFDNTNAVSMPEQVDQTVHGVFFQTFTKSCQITSDTLQIILPKILLSTFFIKRFHLTMDLILIALLKLL